MPRRTRPHRRAARALRKTKEAYLGVTDKMVGEFPKLALMGSCVLSMLMKGEDMYVMGVGDSRAVLATMDNVDLEHISVGSFDSLSPCLSAVQLTSDHSTSMPEEVRRIRNEHPDDPLAISKDRVKGSLKVTRAFGASFLKQEKPPLHSSKELGQGSKQRCWFLRGCVCCWSSLVEKQGESGCGGENDNCDTRLRWRRRFNKAYILNV